MPQIVKTSMRGLLKKAYVLAFFIHGDEEIAARLVVGAAEKLEVAATAQAKRLYYRPVARNRPDVSDARDARHKMWLSDVHLLQRLIYVESESYERRKEQSGACDEEDFILYFIKHLIRIALRRNCFYMAVGVCRLLHHYSTAETMQLYEAVAQDPVHLKDDYYYRSRKGVLMNELKERFGDLLHVYRSSRGEERFDTADQPGVYAELVRECLTFFTPWTTPCLVPDTFEGFPDVPGLIAHSVREQDQVEVNRVHAVVHPECYARLIRGFGFEAPEEMLAVPQFFLRQDGNGGSRARRPDAPALTDEKIEAIEQELARQALRRKKPTRALLRIAVDGMERARLDPNVDNKKEITIDKTAELIEVLTDDSQGELLLATHLITHPEAQDRAQSSVHAVELESGERIMFEIAEGAAKPGNVKLSVVYRARTNTVPVRLLGQLADKLAGVLPGLPFRSPAVFVTLVFALFVFALIGWYLYTKTRHQRINKPEVSAASPSPENQKAARLNAAPTPGPSASPNRPEEPQRAKKNNGLPKEKQALAPTPNNRQPEEQTTGEITRAPAGQISGISLGEVRKVFVEAVNDDAQVQLLVARLRASLPTANVITLTEKPDEADAVLKVSAKSSTIGRQQIRRFTVQTLLVNARGDVLWPAGAKGTGAVYSGSAEAIVSRLKTDLLGKIRRARNRP